MRAREAFEDRFDLVMVRAAVEHLRVQVRAGVIHEAAEEILHQFGLQVADQPHLDPVLYTSAGRPPRSSATTASVSSMGSTKYPARLMPRRSPSALENNWPSTMPTSSTVWC